MPEDERLQIRVGILEATAQRMETAISTLAENMQKLAAAELRREDDRQNFGRIWKKLEELDQRISNMKEEEVRDTLNRWRRITLEFLKVVGQVLAGIVIYHFTLGGGHL